MPDFDCPCAGYPDSLLPGTLSETGGGRTPSPKGFPNGLFSFESVRGARVMALPPSTGNFSSGKNRARLAADPRLSVMPSLLLPPLDPGLPDMIW